MTTPLQDGFRFPAEWEPHVATWLTYPHSDDSFPGQLQNVYRPYMRFISEIVKSEKVRINVPELFKERFACQLDKANIDANQVEIFERESDDVWCRDHGPAFVVQNTPVKQKAVVAWEFNAWGNKFPHNADKLIASAVADDSGLHVYRPGIIMEGGAVELNGVGTVITTKACLLNKNRNPHLNQQQIEKYLCDYLGVQQVLWLEDGIEGDDTDGHIDDITRFVNTHTVITTVESNKNDANYAPLKKNLRILQTVRLLDGRQPCIAELPMPAPVFHNYQRLPASYANFYITNDAVIVPTFRCKQDDVAMQIISECFPHHRITDIDSTDIVKGGGSFHCLSQQEPR